MDPQMKRSPGVSSPKTNQDINADRTMDTADEKLFKMFPACFIVTEIIKPPYACGSH